MGLLSYLKRRSREGQAAAPAPDLPDSVQQARTRARQRLIGAVVLVSAGVLGFPLLFETQPRPLALNTHIEIARRDGEAGTRAPNAPPVPTAAKAPLREAASSAVEAGVITETPEEAGEEIPAAARLSASGASIPEDTVAAFIRIPPSKPSALAEKAAEKPAEKPADKAHERAAEKDRKTDVAKAEPAPRVDKGARAEALLGGREAASKPAPAAAGSAHFVVQVGAFRDMDAARDARQKVEKLGLKSYTQSVDTAAGKRIRVRVGPFTDRDDADKAAAKVKTAGLASAVFAL